MATQNLGNVRALIVSATAPTNTNLIWRDTSTSPHTTRLYNTQTSMWVAISMTGGTSDPNAIHDNVAGEIAAVTVKANPVAADLILIEDSQDSNNKKGIQIGSLPVPSSTTSITRQRSTGGASGNPWVIDWNSQNEFLTTNDFIVNANVGVGFGNTTNAELAVIDFQVTNATRTLALPTNSYMQDSESRWTSTTRILTLEVGRYKMTVKVGNDGTNTIYTVECSDQYTTT